MSQRQNHKGNKEVFSAEWKWNELKYIQNAKWEKILKSDNDKDKGRN